MKADRRAIVYFLPSGTTIARGGLANGPSPVARWSLISSQMTVARIRERIFAIQLLGKFSFMR